MNAQRVLFILSRNDKNYHLIKNFIDLVKSDDGRDIKPDDVLTLGHLSHEEKKEIINIFKEDYESVVTKDFTLYRKNGHWIYEPHDYSHTYSIKILFRMNNETAYGYNSIVHGSDLYLVSTLIKQYNRILEVDLLEEIGEAVEGYEINPEMIDFVSMYLENNAGNFPQMDYAFMRVFLNAIQEYDDLLFDNLEEV
jgi:hypothetical protein